jgi:hypothetical protein
MDYQAFINATNEMAKVVHTNAVKHGFYVAAPSLPERLMLMVSELSEALEEFRNGTPTQYVVRETSTFPQYESVPRNIEDPNEWKPNEKPEGVGVELADCIIRILDTCAYEGIDIGALIAKKHKYNLTRPYKHGGKLI